MAAKEWPSDFVLCVSEVKIPRFVIGRDHPGACISCEHGQAEIIGVTCVFLIYSGKNGATRGGKCRDG